MSAELRDVVDRVRERVEPSDEERERLERAVTDVVERTEEVVADLPVEADVLRVGSTARDTWLRGDRDIDVFVRFPPSLDREALQQYGLEVGQSVLPDGRLEYAEHPYVTAEYEGYSIDLVPCYDVESGDQGKSAVDRTPFHATYVAERLTPELATDVRVLKRFLEANGIYGSDLRTQGFSGYLTELLILAYGDFERLIEAAAEWRPPVVLDPADHGAREFDDPLVVIDPTDPNRNVAAVVTGENVARFQHHARTLLDDPTASRFELVEVEPLAGNELAAHIERRETTPVAITAPAPDVVDDQLYPQLRRTRDGIVDALGQRGFLVLRAAAYAREDVLIYLELAVSELPAIDRHLGPPVHVRAHANAFLDRWAEQATYGPFIEGERYVVEREREFTSASAFLRSDGLLDARIGADLEGPLTTDRTVLVGEQVLDLLPAFGRELAAFYDPSP